MFYKENVEYNKQECFLSDVNILAYFYQMFLF